MKITQAFLIFLLGLSTVNCGCAEGTLQCSTEDKPLICDFTSSYVLNEAKDGCEKTTVEGCKVINPDSAATEKCLLCESKKVLDTEKAKCVDVLVDKQKENCETYNMTTSACIGCASDFFVSSGSCVAVGDTKIDNCQVYATATTCSSCASGFYLKDTACMKLETVSNCYSHTLNKCDACDAGYILNVGLNSVVDVNSAFLNSLALGSQSNPSMGSSNAMSVCQKHDVNNCSVFETFDKCSTCNSMYMVTPEFKCLYYPEDPIANCAKYSNAITCSECVATHFLSGNECQERTADANCKTWTVSANTCAECQPTFYITNVSGPPVTTSCLERNPTIYKDCTQVDLYDNICTSCPEGYTMTDDSRACYIDPSNCSSPIITAKYDDDDSFHKCETCKDGYKLENEVCTGTPVDKCEDHTTNDNTCITCETGFYLSGDNCPAQNVSGCKSGNYVTNKNHCETCVSLKFPSLKGTEDPNTCGDITHSNCFSSEGTDDNCNACMPTHKLESAKCDNERTDTYVPANCESNKSSSDDTQCASCNDTFVLIEGDKGYASDEDLAALNCLQLDSSTGDCIQCKDNFELNSGNCVDDITNATANLCVRSIIGTGNTDLSTGNNCELCNATKGKISDGTNCVDYGFSNLVNCATKGSSKDSICGTCETGFTLNEPSYLTCASTTPTELFPEITNCKVYSSLTTCAKCISGENPNIANYRSCQAATGEDDQLGWDTSPVGTITKTTISGCAVYGQIDAKTIGCVQCTSGFVGIVGTLSGYYATDSTAQTFSSTYFDAVNGDNLFTQYNTFDSCLADAEALVEVNIGAQFSGTACAIGALLEVPATAGDRTAESDGKVSGKYVCLQCDDTFKGTLGTITEVLTVPPVGFTRDLTVIVTCDQITDATRTNGVGFGYAKRFDNSQISWNSMFNYSACPSTKTLVYHAKRTETANVGGLPFEYTTTSTYNMECVTTSKLNIDGYTGTVANCATTVYKSDTTPVAVIESESSTVVQCIACAHGFKATADSTTGIVSNCTAITNCNLSASKRTLDTCYEHPNPYTATAKGNYWAVDFDNVHSSAMADCEVVDTNSKCLMCSVGYQPAHDGLSCIQMTPTNTGCAAIGAGPNNLVKPAITDTITAMGNEVQQFVTFMQVRRMVDSFEGTYGAHHSLLCADTCTSGKLLSFPNPGSIRRVCGKNQSSPPVTTIAGCSKPNESAAGCGTCESPSTHIPNTTVDECVEKSTKPNCTAVSGSSKDCTACDAGFSVSSGACVENFCEVIDPDSSACLVCKANSRPHASDIWRCEAPVTADETHECEYWDGSKSKANFCVKCREANKIPYVFDNSSTYSSSCQSWTKGNAEGGYIHPYTYVKFGIVGGAFNYKVITIKVIPDWVNREYNSFISKDIPIDNGTKKIITAENACLKQRTDANCATFIENMYCTSCNPSHYLDLSNNTCVENTIDNCETSVANANECTKCTDNFFLADSTTCTQRTLSTDCEVSDRNLSLDKCTACGNIDKWFKSATGTCEAYTATHCDNKSLTEDKCTTCVQKFWADSSSGSLVCTAVTNVDNCKTYSTTVNQCTHCNDNAWFDAVTTPATPACPLRTEIEFCTATPTDSDSCTTCEGDRYYNSTAKECRDYPVGVANCAVYEYPKTCVLCDSGYFLSSGTCSAVTTPVEGCSIHSSATACGTCTPGTHIANGAACDLITQKTGCVTYSDKDTCSACSGNYFLENGACTASGITGCTEAVKGTPNTCTTCDAGRYLSSDKTSCTAGTSVAGCAIYEDQTTCKTCSTGKIKNADGTKCDSLTSQAGAYCSMASTFAEPACDVCMYGYQKDSEGNCVAVSISNCLIDDGAGKCVLCKPAAFWMNKEGACEAVPEPPCEGDDCGQDIMKLSFTFMLAFFILRLF